MFYILFVFFNSRPFRQWLFAHCSTIGPLYFIIYLNKSLDRTWFLYYLFLTNAYFPVFLFCNCCFTHSKLPLLFCYWNTQFILSCWPCFISKHTFRQPRVCIKILLIITGFLYHCFLINEYLVHPFILLFNICHLTHSKIPLYFCHRNNQSIFSCWTCSIF